MTLLRNFLFFSLIGFGTQVRASHHMEFLTYNQTGEYLVASALDSPQERTKRAFSEVSALKHMQRAIKNHKNQKFHDFTLTEERRLAAATNLLAPLGYYRIPENLLGSNRNIISSLEIVSPGSNLLDKIVKSSTAFGKVVLVNALYHPLTSHRDLQKRAELLKQLVENPEVLRKFSSLTEEMRSLENQIFSYCLQTIQGNSDEPNRFSEILSIGKILSPTLLALGLGYEIKRSINGIKRWNSYITNHELIKVLASDPRFFITLGSAGFLLYSSWQNYVSKQEQKQALAYRQERVKAVAKFLDLSKKLYHLLQKEPAFASCLKSPFAFETILNYLNSRNSDIMSESYMTVCETLLDSSAIENGFSSYEIANIDQKIKSSMIEMAPLFELMGEVDYISATARSVANSGEHNARYSIAIPVEKSEHPVFILKDAWHPSIHKNRIVLNSLELDKDKRGIILSGFNTGGKSTFLKTCALSISLAQGIGIAPADYFAFTPRNVFIFIGNITDQISNGLSLFKTNLDQIRDSTYSANFVSGKLNEEGNKGQAIIFVDEILTGTNEKSAAKGSEFLFKKLLALKKYSNIFVTTHSQEIMDLSKEYVEDGIVNYHMDGTTYQLVPGAVNTDQAEQFANDMIQLNI